MTPNHSRRSPGRLLAAARRALGDAGAARLRALGQGLPLVASLPVLLVAGAPADLGRGRVGGADALPAPIAERAANVRDEAFPLHRTGEVEAWLEHFRTDGAGLPELLERRGAYTEFVLERLRARGMPTALALVPVLESGMSSRATSPDEATGLWQFMEPTARAYGLRIDEWVDERRDPVRSTEAALDYLAFLHDRYGSWYLAAAAYNAGPGAVDRALRLHAGGRRGDDALYWQVWDALPRETRDYVPRLVAATLVAGDLSDPRGAGPRPESVFVHERVFVPGGTSLPALAWRLGIPPSELGRLNRHILRDVTPPGETYPIRVPPGHAERVVTLLRRRPAS